MESCKTCSIFIDFAQKKNILKHFKMVCIDNNTDYFASNGINKVPTIIIPNINKRFEGKECLKWLNDMTTINNNNLYKEELIISNVNGNNSYSFGNNNYSNNNYSNNNYSNNNYSNNNSNNNNYSNNNSNSINNYKNLNGNTNLNINNFNNLNSNNLNSNNLNSNNFNTNLNANLKTNLNANNNSNNLFNNSSKKNVIEPPNIVNNKSQINLNNNLLKEQQQIQTVPIVKPVNQLCGYLQNEMTGFSDTYAWTNIDNPLPKSFLAPDKDMEIYTAPEQDKINKKNQEEMIKKIKTMRDDQQNNFKERIQIINDKIFENKNLIQWGDKIK